MSVLTPCDVFVWRPRLSTSDRVTFFLRQVKQGWFYSEVGEGLRRFSIPLFLTKKSWPSRRPWFRSVILPCQLEFLYPDWSFLKLWSSKDYLLEYRPAPIRDVQTTPVQRLRKRPLTLRQERNKGGVFVERFRVIRDQGKKISITTDPEISHPRPRVTHESLCPQRSYGHLP